MVLSFERFDYRVYIRTYAIDLIGMGSSTTNVYKLRSVIKWLPTALYLEYRLNKWHFGEVDTFENYKISWNCVLENGADLCVNEGHKLSEYRVSLADGRKKNEEGEKSIFDRVWFSRKTAILENDAVYTGSISHVDNDGAA